MISIRNLSYSHPNTDILFTDLNLTVSTGQKLGLTGNNGSGKSTLLKLIAGDLLPLTGTIGVAEKAYYIPQHFGQFNGRSLAHALGVEHKIRALQQILAGAVSAENFEILADDWSVEARANGALADWRIPPTDLQLPMESLSGGQKTRAFLAGILIHDPALILLDEPTNHLDENGRDELIRFIRESRKTIVVVSHDLRLLDELDSIAELTAQGIRTYGGNYSFFREQKDLEQNALVDSIHAREKSLRTAKSIARENAERQQKLDSRGRKKQEKAGLPTILMNTLRNSAEKSTAKSKEVHAEKIEGIYDSLAELRAKLPAIDSIRFGFENAGLHKGKQLINAEAINFGFNDKLLWKENLTFHLSVGERMHIRGANGAGKTSLIKLMPRELEPSLGRMQFADFNPVYIDQEYSLLNNELSVYAQASLFNDGGLLEHEIRIRLVRFLFTEEYLGRQISLLSGGERMRLCLCCLTLSKLAPDCILLDEPTNNLDMQNVDILINALSQYRGAIVLVTHDVSFAQKAGITKEIRLDAADTG